MVGRGEKRLSVFFFLLFHFLVFHKFIYFNWRLITLQYCIGIRFLKEKVPIYPIAIIVYAYLLWKK